MSLITAEPRVSDALQKQRMSAAEFLAWDAAEDLTHECAGGEVFAMAGGEDRHHSLSLNLVASRQHQRGGSCRAHASGVKLQAESADSGVYPDLFRKRAGDGL